jgi:dTDP-glucose 4,6-dehydratase
MIMNCLDGKPLPVYGDGGQIRDWLYVGDHCRAIRTVLQRGTLGQVYNIGGDSEMRNLEVVDSICQAVDSLRPGLPHAPSESLITYVQDRPGHDRRYAIDFTKIRSELGWKPSLSFSEGIRETVAWYLDNPSWIQRVTSGVYRGARLGLSTSSEATSST